MGAITVVAASALLIVPTSRQLDVADAARSWRRGEAGFVPRAKCSWTD